MSGIGGFGTMIADLVKWLVYLGIPAMFLYFGYKYIPQVRRIIDPMIGKKSQYNVNKPEQPVSEQDGPAQQPAVAPQGTHYRDVYVLKKIRIVEDDEQPSG